MTKRLLSAVIGAVLATGCVSSPTPLAPQNHGSVGLPHFGVLAGGTLLPADGDGYVWLRPLGKHYGTQRLVSLLTGVSKRMHVDEEHAPVVISDLSGEHGGPIEGHWSHRTGRDVDVLFQYVTPDGVPTRAPGFIQVGRDGLAWAPTPQGQPAYLRFDVPRNWELVKQLVTAPEADVLWIFCVVHLEALLIEYARAKGEDPLVIWKAESVLQQPTDSLPHDDHFHVRIACGPEEELTGCQGGGPRWPWLEPAATLPPLDEQGYAELVEGLDPP